jgi:histidinol phosphatase-like PHP family hydrolase
VHDDASVQQYLDGMKNQPCFVALQGEGREWMTLVSPATVARFDYVFTDAMTFTDDHGKRMRIWIDSELGAIPDPQAFMDMYVKRIEGVMREPIDIYANATFLPTQIASQYDTLWTPERRQKVIAAAIQNDVAIEINNRYKIPSATFIKEAKAAGAKFSFGTNNAEADLGRLEYPLAMVKECGLAWQDIFVPRASGQKKIQSMK